MSQIKCTHCGEDAVRATTIDNIFVCGDDDCLLELTNEHFIDESIDIDELNREIDEDYLNEEE